jgi:hypothetical protein
MRGFLRLPTPETLRHRGQSTISPQVLEAAVRETSDIKMRSAQAAATSTDTFDTL